MIKDILHRIGSPSIALIPECEFNCLFSMKLTNCQKFLAHAGAVFYEVK